MLRELAVKNLALIEDVRVELRPGFCAWTGETGAGKTLLLSALGLLLGERGNTDLIRAGAEELRIVGLFTLVHPEQRAAIEQIHNEPIEDDQLVLMRRLSRSGRGFAYVNESPVSVGALRRLGQHLVGVHGQRESHALLDPAYQLRLLDSFGDLNSIRTAYLKRAEEVRGLRRRHAELLAQRQQRQRELALLRFERDELAAAQLTPDEQQRLSEERDRLVHALSLCSFAENGCERLYDREDSIFDQLGKLLREAEKWSEVDAQLLKFKNRLETFSAETQELAADLRDLGRQWRADPARLEEVDERLQNLRKLETKYGKSIDELILYQQGLDQQEAELQQEEDDLTAVQVPLRKAWQELVKTGTELSRRRKKVAKRLTSQVQKHLTELGMKEAQLDAAFEPITMPDDPATGDVPADGIERFEILLVANKGETALPLRKVASGGELSRAMLALKSVLAAADQVGTLVFDEIDANVGGRLGDVLGQKLAALGQTRQIICVTHLPQVASYAQQQWTIGKSKRGRRTVTTIEPLDEAARVEELASMLRGESRSTTTRREAAAMLQAARAFLGKKE